MPITHAGFLVPGMVEPWSPAEWDQQTQITSLFGVEGVGVLFGGRMSRTLSIPIWCFNDYETSNELEVALQNLDKRVGKIGTILENAGTNRQFPLCYLESVQRRGGVIPPNPDLGWSQKITINFRQLTP